MRVSLQGRRREPVLGDPVGFIRVPAPHPPDFSIVNAYDSEGLAKK